MDQGGTKKCIPGQGNDNSRTRDHIPHTFAYIIDFIHAGGTGTAIQVDIKDICSLIKVRGSCSRHFQPSSPSKESDTIEKRELCVSSQFINNDHTGAAIPFTLNYSQKRLQFARLQRHIHNIICSLIKVRRSCSRHFQPSSSSKESDTVEKKGTVYRHNS